MIGTRTLRAGVLAARVAAGVAGLTVAHPVQAADDFAVPPPALPRLGDCGVETDGFRLPGSDGCLRFSGTVAAEGAVATGGGWTMAAPAFTVGRGGVGPIRPAETQALSRSAIGVGTRLSADLRLPTDYGPLRVFLSMRGVNGQTGDRLAR